MQINNHSNSPFKLSLRYLQIMQISSFLHVMVEDAHNFKTSWHEYSHTLMIKSKHLVYQPNLISHHNILKFSNQSNILKEVIELNCLLLGEHEVRMFYRNILMNFLLCLLRCRIFLSSSIVIVAVIQIYQANLLKAYTLHSRGYSWG